MGVSCLIGVVDMVEDLGVRAGFCIVTSMMTKTFKIVGLLQASRICETEEEVLQGG